MGWYIKNTKDASKIRTMINQVTTREELVDIITEYFNII